MQCKIKHTELVMSRSVEVLLFQVSGRKVVLANATHRRVSRSEMGPNVIFKYLRLCVCLTLD